MSELPPQTRTWLIIGGRRLGLWNFDTIIDVIRGTWGNHGMTPTGTGAGQAPGAQHNRRSNDALLEAIAADIGEIKTSLAAQKRTGELNTFKLWGTTDPDLEDETEKGRVPKIERRQERDNDRLTRLERFALILIGAGLLVGLAIKIAPVVAAVNR